MKTNRLVVLLFFINIRVFSQTVDLLKSQDLKIEMLLNMANNIEKVDISKSSTLRAILNLDVIEYYKLGERYNSPSSR